MTDDELHAFVDGQLTPERVPAVLAWLHAHDDAAARVAQWQAQRLQLRQMARAIELDDSPPALTGVVLRAAGRARRRTAWQQAAAAAVLLAVGVTAGRWWGPLGSAAPPTLAASPEFVREAVIAHAVFVPETRHPVEVAAAEEAHLVQWLSRRLGAPLKAPSLVARGYRLLGGRLLPGEDAPRAQFMYENAQGARVTLFVAVFPPGHAPAQTSFRSVRDSSGESFYWVEDRFGYALSMQPGAPDMQALAREVHAQLTR
ncbi:MAG TPA: anti-sigma factor [Albitalea sp.]|nr:anti-sigma factor [Albitalea sp.]HJW10231.1 anti-sigma factor [Albitalea sp.]